MKKRLLIPVVMCIFVFTSCSLADKLGFDTYDYMGEKVTVTHDINGECAEMIAGILDVLITDKASLPTFDKMSDAINEYRDAVLLYMLKEGYAKYSGNTELIAKAEAEYPEYTISQVIPVSEFEATMYRYFGGNVKITHRDGERFKYLPKVGAYISPAVTESAEFTPGITELCETDKTYRVRFRVLSPAPDSIPSEEYFALIIKRDDGTLYFKKLLYSADIK
ncbi:MAG: hypothetical protein ACI4XJ_08340 [Eubacteriales bacterium]